jgi:uncharacterized protein Veg
MREFPGGRRRTWKRFDKLEGMYPTQFRQEKTQP